MGNFSKSISHWCLLRGPPSTLYLGGTKHLREQRCRASFLKSGNHENFLVLTVHNRADASLFLILFDGNIKNNSNVFSTYYALIQKKTCLTYCAPARHVN